MSNIRRYYQEGQVYFLTHVTYQRRPILLEYGDLLWRAIDNARSATRMISTATSTTFITTQSNTDWPETRSSGGFHRPVSTSVRGSTPMIGESVRLLNSMVNTANEDRECRNHARSLRALAQGFRPTLCSVETYTVSPCICVLNVHVWFLTQSFFCSFSDLLQL